MGLYDKYDPFHGVDVNSSDIEQELAKLPAYVPPPPPPAPETGIVKGTAQTIGRGIAGIGENAGQAMEWNPDYQDSFVNGKGDESKLSVMSKAGHALKDASAGVKDAIGEPVANSFAKKAWFGGVESLPVSLAYAIPSYVGAVGGAALGVADSGGVASIPQAIAGAAAGQALTSPIMYRSAAQQTADDLRKLSPTIDNKSLMDAAVKAGHAEWMGEAISDIPEAVIFSRLPGFKGVIKSVREGIKPTAKTIGKNMLATQASEQLGENYTTWQQTNAMNAALPADKQQDMGQNLLDTVGSTAVMSLLMGGAGTGAQYYHGHKIEKALENPTASPEKRGEAAGKVFTLLKTAEEEKQLPEGSADNFLRHAMNAIGSTETTGSEPYALDLTDVKLLQPFTAPDSSVTVTDSTNQQVPATPGQQAGTTTGGAGASPAPGGADMGNIPEFIPTVARDSSPVTASIADSQYSQFAEHPFAGAPQQPAIAGPAVEGMLHNLKPVDEAGTKNSLAAAVLAGGNQYQQFAEQPFATAPAQSAIAGPAVEGMLNNLKADPPTELHQSLQWAQQQINDPATTATERQNLRRMATDNNPNKLELVRYWRSSTNQRKQPAAIAGMTPQGAVSSNDTQQGKTTQVDQAANAAATSPKNNLPEPTTAQIEAGNYKKGHLSLHGLDISIENPAGSSRKGVDVNGKPWETKLAHHYGYFKGTIGRDKDHVDTFIGPKHDSQKAFVVDQVDPKTGKFDEHKVMLGFNSIEEARQGYLANYDTSGPSRIGAITETPVDELKKWLKTGKTKQQFASHLLTTKPVVSQKQLNMNVKRDRSVKPTHDDLITAIGKLGGLNRDQAISQWGNNIKDSVKDLNTHASKQGSGFLHAVSKNGKELDTMREALEEHGYLQPGSTIEDMYAKIDQHLGGRPSYSNQYEGQTAEQDLSQAPDGVEESDYPFDLSGINFPEKERKRLKYLKQVFKNAKNAKTRAQAKKALDRFAEKNKQTVPALNEENKQKTSESTAPEHAAIGVDDRELSDIVDEFNEAQERATSDEEQITHIFDAPAKTEIVRLQDKVKVFNAEHGWMTPDQAKAKIAEWKQHAKKQGDTRANSDKVVLSLFDLSGQWSQPWVDAGYQVFRFDIQEDPEVGNVHNFSHEHFMDWFADFDGMDIHAILAACPCTDFAVSGARHFAAKDSDGRTVASVKLVHQTLATIEHFKPAVWAIENPVGRIEKLGGLPPWRLSFDPNHLGEPYTKKTLLWGRFNGELPIAPVDPVEGSKMHSQYGGKSLATKNARSVTPEGFAYSFFMANNAIDNPVMAVANKYDRLDRNIIKKAIDAGMTAKQIDDVVEDYYYQELDDQGAEDALENATTKLQQGGDQTGGQIVAAESDALRKSQPESEQEYIDTVSQRFEEKFKDAIFEIDEEEQKQNLLEGNYAIDRIPQEAERAALKGKLGAAANVAARNGGSNVADAGAGKATGEAAYQVKANQAKALTAWAKEHNLLIDPKEFNRQWKIEEISGAEHEVYFVEKNRAIKRISPSFTTWSDYFNRVALHNFVFPDTAYDLKGFILDNGKLYAVVDQPFIEQDKVKPVTDQEIFKDMKRMGFTHKPSKGMSGDLAKDQDFYHPSGIVMTDLHDANVFRAYDGTLAYIDAIIWMDYATKYQRLAEQYGINAENEIDVEIDLPAAQRNTARHKAFLKRMLKNALPASQRDRIQKSLDKFESRQKHEAKPITSLADFAVFHKEIRTGLASASDLQKAFASFNDHEQEIITELSSLKKDQLLQRMGSWTAQQYKNDKKDVVVKALFQQMQQSFMLDKTLSYMMSGADSRLQAIKKAVEGITDTDIATYVDKLKQHEQDVAQRKQEITKAIQNPETLEEFGIYLKTGRKIADLPADKRVMYDELVAASNRNKQAQNQVEKNTVSAVDTGETSFKMVEGTHSKTGEKLFIVQLDGPKLEGNTFKELAQKARQLGGNYVNAMQARMWKTTAGFQFKSQDNAEKFMSLQQGDVVKTDTTPEKKATVTAKLRETATSLKEKAEEELNRDRLANTAKRAAQASSAEESARRDIALAETMLNLADAIDNGEATHLNNISAKTHVEQLNTLLNQAKWRTIRNSKTESMSNDSSRPATLDDVDQAEYPFPAIWGTHMRDIAKALMGQKGAAKLVPWLAKATRSYADELITFNTPEALDNLRKIHSILEAKGKKWEAEKIKNELMEYDRVQRMGLVDLPTLRAALREFLQYRAGKRQADKAKELERALIGQKVGFDFFPTPTAVAEQMVELAGIKPGMKVLEPSAGNANIAEVIREAGADVEVAELSSSLREVLDAKGFNVIAHDFMDLEGQQYDAIVMNPPFSNNQDIKHVQHAYDLLKPGGKLVAIVGEGAFFRNGKTEEAFRNWLDDMGADVEKLPEGTFTDRKLMNTTSTNARMVVLEKSQENSKSKKNDEGIDENTSTVKKPAVSNNVVTQQQVNDIKQQIQNIRTKASELKEKKTVFQNGQSSVVSATEQSLKKSEQLFAEANELENQWFAAIFPDQFTGQEMQEAIEKGLPHLAPTPATSGPSSNPSKLEDFGEKIGGARKDFAAKFADAKNLDLATEPISKTWPEPDYNKMLEQGFSAEDVAIARSLRDEVADKPRKSYQLRRWVELVKDLRDHTEKLLSGDGEHVKTVMNRTKDDNIAVQNILGRAELYQEVGHDVSLKGVTFGRNHWALYKKKENVWLWQITKNQKATAFGNMPQILGEGDTKEEALSMFKKNMDNLLPKGKKPTSFNLYHYSSKDKPGYYIGKKMGKDYIDLQHFDTLAEAKTYLKDHQAELEAQLAAMKNLPSERRDNNNPRIGENIRDGKDATPEMFQNAFGFRGVEFGNYVNSKERQENLNETFDALHDLAAIIGIPTKGVSLNGELGIAFGARGHGGKHAAMAHYESEKVVINLTKNKGAGSLAHEWFHALDSYLSRKRGYKDAFITDHPTKYGPQDQTRQELMDAFKKLNKALNLTNLKLRSRELDRTRSKAYWSTGIEMHARAFENYIIDKLEADAKSNDYLANINSVSEYADALLEGFLNGKTADDLYPYLLDNEKEAVRAAFDNLFATLQNKETDKGVELFSLSPSPTSNLKATDLQKEFADNPLSSRIKVVQSVEDLPGIGKQSRGLHIEGQYKDGTIYLVADFLPTVERAKVVALGHELTHAGQSAKLTNMSVKWYRDAQARGENGSAFQKAAMQILKEEAAKRGYRLSKEEDYRKAVQEATAVMAEHAYRTGERPPLITRLLQYLKYFLRNKLGLKKIGFTDKELLVTVTEMMRKGEQNLLDGRGPDGGQFAAAWHGSPHDHNGFSTEHIGTGEGAQSYGYGLYFAGNREVAEYYRSTLAGDPMRIPFRTILKSVFPDREFSMTESSDIFNGVLQKDVTGKMIWNRNASLRDIDPKKLDEVISKSLEASKGRLYKVELTPSEDEYLLWDKPLSEQSEKMKAALEGNHFGNYNIGDYELSDGNFTGEGLYKEISDRRGDKAASEYLHSLGIRGIKYLDGNSRNGKKEDYNYVIFNDADVTIEDKYSLASSVASTISDVDWSNVAKGVTDNWKQTINPLDYSRAARWFDDWTPESIKSAFGYMLAVPHFQAERDATKRPFVDASENREIDRMDMMLQFLGFQPGQEDTRSLKEKTWDFFTKWQAGQHQTDWEKMNQRRADLSTEQKRALDALFVEGDVSSASYSSLDKAMMNTRIARTKPTAETFALYRDIRNHMDNHVAKIREQRMERMMREAGVDEGAIKAHIADYRNDLREVGGWMTRNHGDGEHAAAIYHIVNDLKFAKRDVKDNKEQARLPYFPGNAVLTRLQDLAKKDGHKIKVTPRGAVIVTGDQVQGFMDKAAEIIPEIGPQKVMVFSRYHQTKGAARNHAEQIKQDLKAAMPHNYRPEEQYEVITRQVDMLNESMYQNMRSDMAVEALLEQSAQRALKRGDMTKEQYTEFKQDLVQNTAEVLMGRAAGRYQIRRAEYLIEGYDTENAMSLYQDYMMGVSGMMSKADYAAKQFENFRTAKIPVKQWAAPYIFDSLRNQGLGDRISGNLRAFASLWYMGLKPASALINATQNYTLGIAELGRHIKKGSPLLMVSRANADIIKGKLSQDEEQLFESAIYRQQEMGSALSEITGHNEAATSKAGKLLHNITGKTLALFQNVEVMNRKTMILAAYRAFRSKDTKPGMIDTAALDKAMEINSSVNFNMHRGNLPGWARTPVGHTLYALQSFTFNSFNWMFNRLTSGEKRDVVALLRYSGAIMAIGGAAALAGGDELDKLFQKLFKRSLKLEFQQFTHNNLKKYGTFGELADAFAWHGLGGVSGLNISNSLRLQIPVVSQVLSGEDLSASMSGVMGGLLRKGATATKAAAKGDWYRATEAAAPEAVSGAMRAYRQYDRGVTTLGGKVVFDENSQPVKYSAADATLRTLGLQPLGQSKRSEISQASREIAADWNSDRQNRVDAVRIADTPAEKLKAMNAVKEFNTELRKSQAWGLVLPISMDTLKNAIQQRRSKADKNKGVWQQNYLQ